MSACVIVIVLLLVALAVNVPDPIKPAPVLIVKVASPTVIATSLEDVN